MSLYSRIAPRGATGFGYGSTAEQVTEGLDLSGKTYLVTGCNSGLGLETCRVLLMRGARVVGAARTEDKARDALAPFGGETVPVACELSEPDHVRRAVEAVRALELPIDGLICNAGIMALPDRQLHHGVELQLLTNHVGHFLLVTGLLDRLTERGRVVVLSSAGHQLAWAEGVRVDDWAAERGYDKWRNYGQSKLANLLFARELARRLEGGRTAHAVHPGVIETNLGRHMVLPMKVGLTLGSALLFKSVPEGAATQTYVATHPDAARVTGEYWADCNVARSSRQGRDPELARRLWEATEALVATL